jgi:fumarate reductase subunit D
MRTGAIVCFVLAALTTVVAVANVIGGPNRPEGAENLVGYAVGSFLVPVVLLIVGLILWGKSGPKNSSRP